MAARKNPLERRRWWDATWNPVGGCKMADSSCYYCYAPPEAAGLQTSKDVELYLGTTKYEDGRWTWNGRLTEWPPEHPGWNWPLTWRNPEPPLLGPGQSSLLWCGSMTDVFLPGRSPQTIDRIFTTVAHSRHIGLVVTKRPKQMAAYFSRQPAWWRERFWLGFSAGEQRPFDVRWKRMRPLAEQGWLVFVSLAPLIEEIILPPDFLALAKWVTCGGEQHPGKREMDLAWARSLRDQCHAATPRIPIFVKQATRGWLPPGLILREFPKV